MWNWYEKNRKRVALGFVIACSMSLALNIAGEIVKPDILGAVAILLSAFADVVWIETLLRAR